jgi:DNA ligase-1
MLEKIRRKRVAILSGWAVEPDAIYRYQVDAAFPLSDHADYNDLVRYVDLVRPKRVLTLHGFAAEFARDLRQRGVEAWALTEENQLDLALHNGESTCSGVPHSARPPRTARCDHEGAVGEDVQFCTRDARTQAGKPCASHSEFATFAQIGESIGATAAKSEKVRVLGDYLRTLDEEQLPVATTYFTGRIFAQSDPRTLQVGASIIYRAIMARGKLNEVEFRRIAHIHGDAGKTALEALEGQTNSEPFALVRSRDFLEALRRAPGPIAKTELLQKRLSMLSAREAQYVVKILTGDLRIGLREGLVEDAIARAFDAAPEEVKQANMLLGDIGTTAVLALRKELHRAELSIFRPIKCMLATPEPTAEAIWKRLANQKSSIVYAEDKFDGIRAQLHRDTLRAEIFSRDLKRITDQFPELSNQASHFDVDLILDGEIVAFELGRRLTFFDLQTRLGRKPDGADLFATPSAEVPVAFIAFDLLWLNGRSLLKTRLRERRQLLRTLKLPAQFQISEVFPVRSAKEIEQIFQQARRRMNEGLMIKDPESSYSPGSRGMFWFKLKKELATLDVVVVGTEFGHGKRHNVLSDYTFAVRDEASGELLPIGKAYSGLTDAEIAELTKHFQQNTIAVHGRYREVKPDVVLEVAFNSIQPSTRHASGFALRFPRIKSIRRDKNAESIDTLKYVRELAAQYAKASADS